VEYLKGNQRVSMFRGVFLEYSNPDIACGICPGRLSMCFFYGNLCTFMAAAVAALFWVWPRATLSFYAVIDHLGGHSLGICTAILLPLLPCWVEMTVSPRA
jgi:hypothetical protein